MIVRSPPKNKPESTPICCPRSRLFALLALALASFVVLRSSVGMTSVNSVISSSSSSRTSSSKQAAATVDDGAATAEGDVDSSQFHSSPSPKIVWLTSYPNSGTSYTMTLVERASNLSTATNYGAEVTFEREDSLSIYPTVPQGPFWDGLSGKRGRPRLLPSKFVLTKTHCGGRCIKCEANEYVVTDTDVFVQACQRSTYRLDGTTVEGSIPKSLVHGMVHLIRNPYHNTVARFHLERRNLIHKDPALEATFPSNAKGFERWCEHLDRTFAASDKVLPQSARALMKGVPCYAEFFKWTQWHNLALMTATAHIYNGTSSSAKAQALPVHTVWYEDYDTNFNATFVKLMEFLRLPIVANQLQTFRNLPTYDDHYSNAQRRSIRALIQHVASNDLWPLIQHYLV